MKNLFYTEFSNFPALQKNYDNVLIHAGSKSENFSESSIWEFKAMSRLELYLNSPKAKQVVENKID